VRRTWGLTPASLSLKAGILEPATRSLLESAREQMVDHGGQAPLDDRLS